MHWKLAGNLRDVKGSEQSICKLVGMQIFFMLRSVWRMGFLEYSQPPDTPMSIALLCWNLKMANARKLLFFQEYVWSLRNRSNYLKSKTLRSFIAKQTKIHRFLWILQSHDCTIYCWNIANLILESVLENWLRQLPSWWLSTCLDLRNHHYCKLNMPKWL